MKKKIFYILEFLYIGYKTNADTNKTQSNEHNVNKIRPYLKDINNLKKSETWKIAINFVSSKDTDEKRLMHLISDNIKIMINDKGDEI